MASKRDYYEVLGVEKGTHADVIKKAYKKLALANHPDRNPGDEDAVERFKEASEAFEVLNDTEKRSLYNRYGHAGVTGANGGPSFTDVGDIFDAFGDLFEGFGFSGGGGRGGPSRARQGTSLKTSITIDLLDAAAGCSRNIEIRRKELCTTCDGSGAKPGSRAETCDYCAGNGQVVQSQGFFRVQTTCPACRGEGNIVREKCGDCGGSGRTSEKVQLEVKVPAGVDNGMELRLTGEGEPGDAGAPRGDLYVAIRVKAHPLFQRDERHLTCRVPITCAQAALGTTMEIPILEGRYELAVPAGTQPGEVIKLRGYGMPDPHGGSRGDLFVQISVEVPKGVSSGRHEELYRELAELEHTNVSPQRKSFFDKLKEYFATDDEESDET